MTTKTDGYMHLIQTEVEKGLTEDRARAFALQLVELIKRDIRVAGHVDNDHSNQLAKVIENLDGMVLHLSGLKAKNPATATQSHALERIWDVLRAAKS